MEELRIIYNFDFKSLQFYKSMKILSRFIPIFLSILLITLSSESFAQCSTPGGRAAGSITSSSVTLSWNSIASANDYVVRYRISGNWIYKTATTNSLSLTGLTSSSQYVWQVRSRCTSENSSFSKNTYFTTSASITCGDVTGTILSSDQTDASVTVNWDSSQSALEYRIRYRPASGGSYTYITDIADTTYTVTGLTEGTSYEFYLKGECTANNLLYSSNWSSKLSATTEFTDAVCDVPTGGEELIIDDDSATLVWDVVSGANGYRLRYDSTGIWEYTDVTDTFFVWTNLEENTDYRWMVRTYCNDAKTNLSDWTSQKDFTTDYSIDCQTPTTPDEIFIGSDSAVYAWDSYDDAVEFRVALDTTGTFEYVDITDTFFAIGGLSESTDYRWKVRAICSADDLNLSEWTSQQDFTTDFDAVCADEISNAVDDSVYYAAARINWEPHSEAVDYRVRYRDQGGTFIFVDMGSTDTSLVLTGLDQNTVYEYEVRAICNAEKTNLSGWYDAPNFRTLECVAPDNFLESGLSDDGVTISWDSVDYTNDYILRYFVKGSTVLSYDTVIDAQSSTLSGLYSGTQYRYEAASYCGDIGDSILSSYSKTTNGVKKVFTTTGTTVCSRATGTSATVMDDNTINFSWTGDEDAVEYQIAYRVIGTGAFTYTDFCSSSDTTFDGFYAGTTYQWKVNTICTEAGDLASTFTSIKSIKTTGDAACQPAGNFTTGTVNSSSADLTWDVVDAADTYKLRYRIYGSNSTYSTVQDIGTESYTLTGLTAGATYEVGLVSVCNAEATLVSTVSGNIQFTTTGSVNCLAPGTAHQNFYITSDTCVMVWQNRADAVTYKLRYRDVEEPSWSYASDIADTTYTLAGLDASTLYEYQLLSVCNAEGTIISGWGKYKSFSTLAPARFGLFDEGTVSEFELYPNPIDDVVYFEIPSGGKLSIVDGAGKLIYQTNVTEGEIKEIDFSEFDSGVYFGYFNSETAFDVKRFVKN
jgi:hypothetical protein